MFPGFVKMSNGMLGGIVSFWFRRHQCFKMETKVVLDRSQDQTKRICSCLIFAGLVLTVPGFGGFESVLRQGEKKPLAASRHPLRRCLCGDCRHRDQAADHDWQIHTLCVCDVPGDENGVGESFLFPACFC